MNYESLRELFESLCDYLEEDAVLPLQFRAGWGFESPAGVIMVFVFDTFPGRQEPMVVVCRFSNEALKAREGAVPLTSDECLGLIEKVRSLEDNLQDLFVTY